MPRVRAADVASRPQPVTDAEREGMNALYAPSPNIMSMGEPFDEEVLGQDATPQEAEVNMPIVEDTVEAPVEPRRANDRDENGAVKLRSIWDIISDLSKPLPESIVRTRRQGTTNIRYVAWHDATRVLDMYAPGWRYEIRFVSQFSIVDRNGQPQNKIMQVVRITIPTLEGDVFREATGNEDDVTTSYGDPFSNSESMALRRAASKFGLARYLYNG
jgi:hypothetical protein